MDNDTRTEILFGRLMLLKLRQSISRFDTGAYVNMRNDIEFRDFNHSVIKAVVCLLHPDVAKKGEQDDWQKCLPVSIQTHKFYCSCCSIQLTYYFMCNTHFLLSNTWSNLGHVLFIRLNF